ncbi:hypothetical protein NYE24_20570 [Paenibacillus sp. FSL H7-0350]|uniref:hypothetical protein n=1 Tax=Paenibacillus sp. FSL H7-0350 TaxID=2975345 RepID=UPI003158DB17
MANTATVNLITGDVYGLYINGKYIVGDTFSRVDAVKQRLNYIFADPNRDLDFITPSYENGQYVISCPRVRRNVGQVTYLYDTNGSDGGNSIRLNSMNRPTGATQEQVPPKRQS